jgi:hypothetical protein
MAQHQHGYRVDDQLKFVSGFGEVSFAFSQRVVGSLSVIFIERDGVPFDHLSGLAM